MANEKISGMSPPSFPFEGGEMFPLVQTGDNCAVDFSDLFTQLFQIGNLSTVGVDTFYFFFPTFGQTLQIESQNNGIGLLTGTSGKMFFDDSGDFIINSGDSANGLTIGNGEFWQIGTGDNNITASVGDTNWASNGAFDINAGTLTFSSVSSIQLFATDLQINSVSGFTGTVTPVTSITVQNGIVTAVS